MGRRAEDSDYPGSGNGCCKGPWVYLGTGTSRALGVTRGAGQLPGQDLGLGPVSRRWWMEKKD
jgi:hypothetical protein